MKLSKPVLWAIATVAHFFLLIVMVLPFGCKQQERRQIALQPGQGLYQSVPINQANAEAALQQVLDKYVCADGTVDYGRLSLDRQSRGLLDIYLSYVANLPPWTAPAQTGQEQRRRVALLLNANQAAMLRAVVEFYPIESLDDIPVDFDDGVGFDIAGCCLSAAELTQWIQETNYPLVEFACFAPTIQGPPPLRQVLRAETLDEQLWSVMKRYLHHPSGLRIDHETRQIQCGRALLAYEDYFVGRYPRLFREPYRTKQVILATALIPELDAAMQYQVANVIGYRPMESKRDRRINDIEREQDQ